MLHLIHRKRFSLRLGHRTALALLTQFTTVLPLRYPSPTGEGLYVTPHPSRSATPSPTGEGLFCGSPSRRALPIETVGEGSPLPKALIRTKTQTRGDASLVIFVGAFSELPQTTYGSPTKRRLIRSIVRQPFYFSSGNGVKASPSCS